MTPFLQLSLALAILVAAAKGGGYLSYRLGQPSVLGELMAGLELHLADLAKSGKVSALAGVLGVIFPLALGRRSSMTSW